MSHFGNIIKTTPILHALQKSSPGCEVTWLVDPPGDQLIERNPLITNILRSNDPADISIKSQTEWDLVLSLDANPRAAALASDTTAGRFLGYTLTKEGKVGYKGDEFAYLWELGVDNELRFQVNRTPIHQLYFEMLGVEYEGEEYMVRGLEPVSRESHRSARYVGVYLGGSKEFLTKQWSFQNWQDLTSRFRGTVVPMYLGGSEVRHLPTTFKNNLVGSNIAGATFVDTFNALRNCACVVSTDGFMLHVASALHIPVVGLFGPTPYWEAPLFGGGEVLVAPASRGCGPCYKRDKIECDRVGRCMDSITPDMVMAAVRKVVG